MFTINISGLEQLGSVCERLSRMEELEQALKSGAEQTRTQAAQNFPAAGPLTVEPGAVSLSWRVTMSSETGWRREWGELHKAPQPWLASAAEASREAVVGNARDRLGAIARALR